MSAYKIQSGLFGYYRFFGFRPLFYLRAEGIEYKGRLVLWQFLRKVELYDYCCYGDEGGIINETEMRIYFDGGRFRIPPYIVQKGDGDRNRLWAVTTLRDCKSDAYRLLEDYISKSVPPKILFERESLSERDFSFWQGCGIIILVILFFVCVGFLVMKKYYG